MGGASSNAAIILKAINTIEKKEYILGNIDHTWSVFKEIKEEEIEKTGTQLGELLKQNWTNETNQKDFTPFQRNRSRNQSGKIQRSFTGILERSISWNWK